MPPNRMLLKMDAWLMLWGIQAVPLVHGQTNQIKMTNAVITRVDGITATFDYPENWKLEHKPVEGGKQSPQASIRPSDLLPEVIMSFHGKWDDGTKAEYIEFIDGSLQELFQDRVDQL